MTSKISDLHSSLKKASKIAARASKHVPTTDMDDLKVRSLILLSHAAIEEYLEEASREIAVRSVDELKSARSLNLPLFSLISFYKSSFAEEFRFPASVPLHFDALVYSAECALEKHKDALENNHGIMTTNQSKLLFPLGVLPAAVDKTLPSSLESFGVKRGGVAHLARIKTLHSRSDVQSEIAVILRLLKSLDSALEVAFTRILDQH